MRILTAALELVLLGGPLGKGPGPFRRLSLILWKRYPLANDLSARLVVFHVRGSLGRNFPRPAARVSESPTAANSLPSFRIGRQ